MVSVDVKHPVYLPAAYTRGLTLTFQQHPVYLPTAYSRGLTLTFQPHPVYLPTAYSRGLTLTFQQAPSSQLAALTHETAAGSEVDAVDVAPEVEGGLQSQNGDVVGVAGGARIPPGVL